MAGFAPFKVDGVKFVHHKQNELRGLHPRFNKIAFISKHYHGRKPKPNEICRCEVIFDTNPGLDNKGALFLKPILPVEHCSMRLVRSGGDVLPEVTYVKWLGDEPVYDGGSVVVRDTTGIKQFWPADMRKKVAAELSRAAEFGYQVETASRNPLTLKVTTHKSKGGVFIAATSATLVSDANAELPAHWPEWIKVRVQVAFLPPIPAFTATVTRAAGTDAELPKQDVPRGLQQHVRELKDPVAITVQSVESTFHSVKVVELSGDPARAKAVYLDNELVGLAKIDGLTHGVWLPEQIEVREFTLSNGDKVQVSSDTLVVVTSPAGSFSDQRRLFSDRVDFKLKDRKSLTWKEAAELKVGDAFAKEYPFQWVADGNWLTTGVVWLPRERPEGSQWRLYPISTVEKGCWDLFLEGLHGKLLDGLIPYHHQVSNREKKPRTVTLTPKQREIEATIKGQMFKGGDSCSHLDFGPEGLVFKVAREGMPTLYILDNPGEGALYYSCNEQDVRDIASGKVQRLTARGNGMKYIIHTVLKDGSTADTWQDKVADVVRTYVGEAAAA